MIPVKTLADCVNVNIANATTAFRFLRVGSVSKDFDTGFLNCVANVSSLPAAANNTGRFVFVAANSTFRMSDGAAWTSDFTSNASLGIALTWGSNGYGQLGNNSTSAASSPVSVIGGFTDWCRVAAGDTFTLGIRTNGTLWSWGNNNFGKLGDNTTVSKSSPVSVVGGFTDWCQVSAGYAHALAVRTGGTAWGWGRNEGRLGDNNFIGNRSSPVSVEGGFTNWCQVSAGGFHSSGVRSNCTLFTWGANTSGQLGDGTTTVATSPISPIGGFTDWCASSSGDSHTVGVRTNCSIWAWGLNGNGQLGDNTSANNSSPVSVVGGFTDWCQASAGFRHTVGLRINGTLWAWGANNNGQLGNNSVTESSSPVSVVGGFTDWCRISISSGANHNVAIRTNGTLWSWGAGGYGRLGINSVIDRSSPTSVVGSFSNWNQISAGSSHTFAVRACKGF